MTCNFKHHKMRKSTTDNFTLRFFTMNRSWTDSVRLTRVRKCNVIEFAAFSLSNFSTLNAHILNPFSAFFPVDRLKRERRTRRGTQVNGLIAGSVEINRITPKTGVPVSVTWGFLWLKKELILAWLWHQWHSSPTVGFFSVRIKLSKASRPKHRTYYWTKGQQLAQPHTHGKLTFRRHKRFSSFSDVDKRSHSYRWRLEIWHLDLKPSYLVNGDQMPWINFKTFFSSKKTCGLNHWAPPFIRPWFNVRQYFHGTIWG